MENNKKSINYSFKKDEEHPFYVEVKVNGKKTKVFVTKEYYDFYNYLNELEKKNSNYKKRCILEDGQGGFMHCQKKKCLSTDCPIIFKKKQCDLLRGIVIPIEEYELPIVNGSEILFSSLSSEESIFDQSSDEDIFSDYDKKEQISILNHEINNYADKLTSSIIKDYIAHISQYEIANKYNLSPSSINKRINSFKNYLQKKYQK